MLSVYRGQPRCAVPGHLAMGARHFGARIARLEDPALLTGRGRFVDDIRLAGALHACFVRSPYAHAKIRSLDAFAARAMPGVHAVLTADDLPARMARSQTRDRAGKVLCRRTCRDAPSGPGTARPNEVPANACGRFAERFRRRCFDPAPSTPCGAHAPIAGRLRRTLRGGAYPWGKRTRNVAPY